MHYKSATKQEIGIISHGHLVWMFAAIAGHVILILIKSEKLKVEFATFLLVCFLFHFKSSFHSQEKQILVF